MHFAFSPVSSEEPFSIADTLWDRNQWSSWLWKERLIQSLRNVGGTSADAFWQAPQTCLRTDRTDHLATFSSCIPTKDGKVLSLKTATVCSLRTYDVQRIIQQILVISAYVKGDSQTLGGAVEGHKLMTNEGVSYLLNTSDKTVNDSFGTWNTYTSGSLVSDT